MSAPKAAHDIFQACKNLILTLSSVATCYRNLYLICIIHQTHNIEYVVCQAILISISALVLYPLADITMFKIIG